MYLKNYLIAISSFNFSLFLVNSLFMQRLILKRKISYRKKKIKRKFIIDYVYGVKNKKI